VNSINLIDGVDGLAGGISLLIALSFGAIFILLNDEGPGVLFCVCLAAVLLGFLVFNAPFPKARIFMGDGGSQFLGFVLALLPLIAHQDKTTEMPMFYAGALVLIPVYDTAAAIWRRIREGRRIDSPDKAHIHHKLMNLGLNARQIDGVLFGLQLLLSLLVILSVKTQGIPSLILLASAYLSCLGFFALIHFMNRKVLLSAKNQES
jgi:UDP-GlcNAc:undecaprenyl-phosphate GlcNAc-1-phosphate transferase